VRLLMCTRTMPDGLPEAEPVTVEVEDDAAVLTTDEGERIEFVLFELQVALSTEELAGRRGAA
jgi:hypothetical protein